MSGTGDCFLAAFTQLGEMHDDGDVGLMLCHGIVTTPSGTFVHAWVEKTGAMGIYVIDVSQGNNFLLAREKYYRQLKVRDVIRYGVQAAMKENGRHEHYGPWDKSFEGMG